MEFFRFGVAGLFVLVSLSIPIATLVFVILIYNKVKKIERGITQ